MDKKIRVALISCDKVGKVMAGPGIRYFELAKALSNYFDCTLFAPNGCDLLADSFKIKTYDSRKASKSLARQIRCDTDVVISQTLRPPLLNHLRKCQIKFIADFYDPLTVETLEQVRYDSKQIQNNTFNFIHYFQALQFECADHILCASDRQRDLYTGSFFGTHSITPEIYNESSDLKNLFSIIPFGLSEKEPLLANGKMLYQKFPQIKKDDKIIFWGGGIWNWFDPLSVIKAIEILSETRHDIKIVFLGVKHPNPKIKQMEMAGKTLEYCRKHDLINKLVFINHDWTPYEDRVNYLLVSAIGVSTHFDNLETRFSFRTRVLDYLWADLPMIVTEGDSMAQIVKENKLGKVVRYKNIDDIVRAIPELLENKSDISKNIKEFKKIFYWNAVVKDLVSVIKNDEYSTKKKTLWRFYKLTLCFYISGLKKKFFK